MTKIKIGNIEIEVNEANTEEEKVKGLQGVKEMPKNVGMLFNYLSDIGHKDFWMDKTDLPLDIIFLNEDQEVISVKEGKPNTKDFVSEDGVAYVLELNKDSGVKKGDTMDFEDEDIPTMKVLAPNGETQMELEGGERIVSRRETKILIKKAKEAEAFKDTDDFEKKCKSLGKYMFKVLTGQDNREPEYVESPK